MKGNQPNPHAAALGKLGGHARLEKLTPEQTKAELLDTVEKNARAAQIMDDLCARSTLEGLKSCFDFIPQDMVSASMSLAGGAGALKGFHGPFQSVAFCPTGGIGPANAREFLGLPNVLCIGGSWVAPDAAVRAKDFATIQALAADAKGLARV